MEIAWLVGPEEKDAYDLYAVVQPSEGVQEVNTDNNTLSLEFSTADISITSLTCENMAEDDYLVTLAIANSGGKTLEGAMVIMENVNNGQMLETTSLERMEPGQQTVLTYMVSSAGLAYDEKGQINLRIGVTPPDGVQEDFTDNNTCSFSLKPAALAVESISPGPGDKHVDPASALKLTFNMNIEEDTGYDRIRLVDEDLNIIVANKDIEGNTLTITPQNILDYGTVYILTIPVDALGDAYGHTMKEDFSLSFTTALPNPEIISAYPGEFMENAALDTEIRLKFNQNILKGYDFSEIIMYGSDDNAIPVTAAVNEEFLILDYIGSLSENTTYSLEVPRGAVQNEKGEAMREEYILTFTTGDKDGGDGEHGGEGDGEDDDSPFSPDNTSNNEYKASIDIGGTERTIEVRTEAGKAVINLGTLAGEIFAGRQNAVVNIPSIPGVNSYTLEMPAEALASSGESSLTVNTAFGSVNIPSGMLSTMKEISGKTAGIAIAAGDKPILPADVKASIGNRPVLQLTLTLDGVETAWNNPAAPVRVSIPYTPTAAELESPESIVIWYIDANSNIITIPNGCYRQSAGAVSFSTTHFSDFAVAFNKADFKDVPDGVWYERAVSFIAARGITAGIGNGNFSPNNRLTRGQFITMMMRAYDIEPDTSPKDNFSDAGNTWYTGYLAAAKQLGISKGVGNNMFAPDIEITRQEMFTLLYNTLRVIKRLPETKKSDEVNPGRTLSEFKDEGQIDSWAREAMTLLVETGTISGNAGKLTPLSTTTRAEMAQVLYNLMTK